ncbi:MAG: recombinase family protein [Pirellulaceae bacterium]
MSHHLPPAGSADNSLARKVHEWYMEAALKAGTNLDGFDPDAPLAVRLAWALRASLVIALAYVRFSSKQQHSDEDQLRANVVYAAQNGMYIPPEYVCVDKAVTGRRLRRVGLDRAKHILTERLASVLLVFTLSRLFRRSYEAYKFVQEEVVENGLRAIAVAQSIDTADERSWKLKFQVHGIMDEMLLEAIAEHCREGLIGLHLKGWITGALGVGFRRREISDAPLTNRGLPRTVPEIDPEAAELIRRHARLHLDGMLLREGWRRWLAAGGPCDPRSTTGRMTCSAYRRLWSNIRLTGRWEFGRKRNQFSTKLDYTRQIERPDHEVATFCCEELRILDDETYLALQAWLRTLKTGPRGPRTNRDVQLWDLTTDMFHCAHCSTPDKPIRYYQTGAHGKGMQCKHGDLCPCKSAVRREEAVRAVCEKLAEVIARDAALVEDVICRSRERDAHGDDDLRREIASKESTVRTLSRRIDDLYDLAGQGSEDDRKEILSRIRSAQTERAAAQLDLARLTKVLERSTSTLTSEDVRRSLTEVSTLLQDAAAGNLGDESVYKALAIFRRLTGGRIWVYVERRKGRKRTNVRGTFRLHLIRAIKEHGGAIACDETPGDEITVWLRKPPRLDAIAERVHLLIDIEGQSYREAAKVLQSEGYGVNSGNVWYSYRRWYEMQGLPAPKRPYNNGNERRKSE